MQFSSNPRVVIARYVSTFEHPLAFTYLFSAFFFFVVVLQLRKYSKEINSSDLLFGFYSFFFYKFFLLIYYKVRSLSAYRGRGDDVHSLFVYIYVYNLTPEDEESKKNHQLNVLC